MRFVGWRHLSDQYRQAVEGHSPWTPDDVNPQPVCISSVAEEPLDAPPTANLACHGCAYRQVEAVGILAGTRQREAAEAFVEFLLSPEVQEAIPLEMFVAPVREGAAVPPEFERYGTLPESAVAAPLAPDVVAANQERWLTQWTAVVMQGRDPASLR